MTDQALKVQEKKVASQAGETTKPENYFVPAVDIFETDGAVTVIAEMPGVNSEQVDVHLEDDVLTIRGSRPPEKIAGARVLLAEYETGNYLRRFSVAETIDQERIQATMTDGLLKVVLPKATPAKPRTIQVKIG